MTFQNPLSGEDSARYLKIIGEGAHISRHQELLQWLQGDIQQFLPHDILLVGWGNFEEGSVQHDLVSNIAGVRSYAPGTDSLPFLLSKLHSRWTAAQKTPLWLHFGEFAPLLGSASLPGTFAGALGTMQSVLVHGLQDRRGRHECLYVLLRAGNIPSSPAIDVFMPCIDAALRQITHLPQQYRQTQAIQVAPVAQARAIPDDASGLSERESEIMAWVAMGKTNSEIGSILNISGYTVKNHMQRIFHKLNVFNRTQAASRVNRVVNG